MDFEQFKICKKCGFVVPVKQNRDKCPVCNSTEFEEIKTSKETDKKQQIPPKKETVEQQKNTSDNKPPIKEKKTYSNKKPGKRRIMTLFKPFFSTDAFDSTFSSTRNNPVAKGNIPAGNVNAPTGAMNSGS
jgi:uncharacterized Zn finger protein (UPF0148 family)